MNLEYKNSKQAIDFEELYITYIEHKKNMVRETTYVKTTKTFKTHILPFFNNIKTNKLDIQLFLKWKMFIDNKPLSVVTKKGIYTELRTMMNWCYKSGYLETNEFSKLDNFRDAYSTTKEHEIRYYTSEQFNEFIKIVFERDKKRKDFKYYVFFNIAFFTGMRKGEINALKWSDLDGNTIKVSRSINLKLKGGVRETPPKNKSSIRSIQIPEKLVEILEEHKKTLHLCG